MFSRLSCGKIQPLLGEYGEGTLPDPAQQARVEAHLLTCARCRKEAAAYQKSADALRVFAAQSTPPVRAPRWEAVAAQIQAIDTAPAFPVQKTHRRRPVLIGFGASGLAVAAAAAAMWSVNRTSDTPRLSSLPVSFGALASPQDILLSAESCVMPASKKSPIAVRVTNNGPSVKGELVVEPHLYNATTRIYRQSVDLPGDGAISRFFVYPKSANNYNSHSTNIDVTLYGPFRTRKAYVRDGFVSGNGSRIGYIGKGVGLLKATVETQRARKETQRTRRYSNYDLQFQDGYIKPENAPDRVVGYEGFEYLVLGKGVETLDARQWRTIRDWVKLGGSLLMLGGKKMAYLQTPEARELLHGAQEANLPTKNMGWLPQTTDTLSTRADASFAAKERTLGVGRIVFVNFDPTVYEFRHWSELPVLWKELTQYAHAPVPSIYLRHGSILGTPWPSLINTAMEKPSVVENKAKVDGEINPFAITLPPLRAVLYVFLGYFLLAIPVTFVTLKRLRRMNLAWVTGPVLAVAFAGGLYLFTADLYAAKMSRRTTGAVIAAAGEPEARFTGYSEIFFPRAGRYKVDVPGAETLEISGTSIYEMENEQSRPQMGRRETSRNLETEDNGSTVFIPALQVNSLAFRRLYHDQAVTLGDGITATLREDAATGRIRGVIHNWSGRTIGDVYLCLGLRSVLKKGVNYNDREEWVKYASLGTLPPGETKIEATIQEDNRRPSMITGISNIGQSIGRWAGRQRQKVPYLVGTLHGSEFGPQEGKWVGGENSVYLVVGLEPLLDPLLNPSAPLAKGGAK